MSANPVIAAAQQDDGEAYVELYELDTSPLFTVNGVATAAGTIYRWTSGIIDVRTEGAIPAAGTRTTSVLTLDRLIHLVDGRAYRIVADLGDEQVHQPSAIASFSTVTIANPYGDGTIPVSQVTLTAPLSVAPAIGAKWTLTGVNAVRFRGNDYTPMPIEVTGFEWAGTGKLPRPKMRVSNVGGLAAALVIANGDLLGARVTRLRTFRDYLDDGEEADPTAFFPPDSYRIDRKSGHHRDFIEFELASDLDQQGLKLPRRIMLRDTCGYTYRQWVTDSGGHTGFVAGTCPYAGTSYFKADDTPVFDPAQDVCGLRQQSCLNRFGNAPLPFLAFPGISISRS